MSEFSILPYTRNRKLGLKTLGKESPRFPRFPRFPSFRLTEVIFKRKKYPFKINFQKKVIKRKLEKEIFIYFFKIKKRIKKLLLGRKLPYAHDCHFCHGEFLHAVYFQLFYLSTRMFLLW